ncbi:MAG: hypothetical protein ACK41C_10945 [Phenylobacterium sp.]|uniref:hypothetical protein n=1 Tax=Phenylobacterium sp. TaxID=1871053 RepID=UPI003919B14C
MTHSASSRLLLGAIAGFVATSAMTAAMRRLHERLPASERYPLPPREVVVGSGLKRSDVAVPVADATLAAHFGFGAAMGALLSVLRPRFSPLEGAAAGLTIWAGSYFIAFPATGVLPSATRHPLRRNALMAAAHLVWGAVAALTLRELTLSRDVLFSAGPMKDRRRTERPSPWPRPIATLLS